MVCQGIVKTALALMFGTYYGRIFVWSRHTFFVQIGINSFGLTNFILRLRTSGRGEELRMFIGEPGLFFEIHLFL